ncbi:MAG: hypothetical protein NW218_11085 [Saprospiraceae bacterium]|nr:hypothetical protein [Saprospiraceae bacterium]
MAIINVQRAHSLTNRWRDYEIIIDGEAVETISPNETKAFNVAKGQHTITAKIDWCSSPDLIVELDENLTQTIHVGVLKQIDWMMPVSGGVIALHFLLKIFLGFEYLLILIFPVFVFLVYILTFGRKRFLTISKI